MAITALEEDSYSKQQNILMPTSQDIFNKRRIDMHKAQW